LAFIRAILTPVALRLAEFFLLFFAGPALFTYKRHRIPAIPVLWVLTAWCLFILLHDPAFDRARLWNAAEFSSRAAAILSLFACAAVIGSALARRLMPPGHFMSLPRSNPRLWGIVMLLYPVLSVYPQGIVYRAFIFERYQSLFRPGWIMVLASATAFAYVHIVFRNRLAVVLTFIAGILFAFRYMQTGSLFVSSSEHALYGCGIFTIGLGRSFYHAGRRSSSAPSQADRRDPEEIRLGV
jgi:membrane protease YdiL (CAAX protease family)